MEIGNKTKAVRVQIEANIYRKEDVTKPRILEVDVIENKFIILFDYFNATIVHDDIRTEAHKIKPIYQVCYQNL